MGESEQAFWEALDLLIGSSKITVDRPKGSMKGVMIRRNLHGFSVY